MVLMLLMVSSALAQTHECTAVLDNNGRGPGYVHSIGCLFEQPAKRALDRGDYAAANNFINAYRNRYEKEVKDQVFILMVDRYSGENGWDYFMEGEMYEKGLGREKNSNNALNSFYNCIRVELKSADYINSYAEEAILKFVETPGLNPSEALLQKLETTLTQIVNSNGEKYDKIPAAKGLGLLFEKQKKYQKALDAYKKALELESSKYGQKNIQKDIKRVEKLMK